jgi:predicted secreted Zn-dependent protease
VPASLDGDAVLAGVAVSAVVAAAGGVALGWWSVFALLPRVHAARQMATLMRRDDFINCDCTGVSRAVSPVRRREVYATRAGRTGSGRPLSSLHPIAEVFDVLAMNRFRMPPIVMKGRSSTCLIASTLLSLALGCATTHPENPALDAYPKGIAGSTEVTYYDIHGSTARELVAEMRKLGPKTAGGGIFFGETQSPLRWDWRLHTDGPVCSTTSVNVYVRSEITLPRWTPPSGAPPDLVAQWKQFIAALETHEIGHKDISGRGARDVLTALRRLTVSCSTFSSEAKRATDGILARMRVEQETYDADTRHSATQGATFPSRLIVAPAPPSGG